MADNLDHIFKVLLIGDAGVGKSSILLQFTDNCFDSNLQSTIGAFMIILIHDNIGNSQSLTMSLIMYVRS